MDEVEAKNAVAAGRALATITGALTYKDYLCLSATASERTFRAPTGPVVRVSVEVLDDSMVPA